MDSDRWTFAAVRALCADGVQLTNGPLNATYLVDAGGTRLFIRERLVDDTEYGQTFAGERYVQTYFARSEIVNIPRLRRVVVDDKRTERFGIFDAIDGSEVAWTSPGDFNDLVAVLREVHSIAGQQLGNVRGPFSRVPVRKYISEIFTAEISRITRTSPLQHIKAKLLDAASLSSFFADEPICLCHGDVQPRNFMRDGEGRFWTIDWEAARYRVAAADFNQFQHGWIDGPTNDLTIARYLNFRIGHYGPSQFRSRSYGFFGTSARSISKRSSGVGRRATLSS